MRRVNRKCANLRFLTNLVVGEKATFALNGTVSALKVGECTPVSKLPQFDYRNCSNLSPGKKYLFFITRENNWS